MRAHLFSVSFAVLVAACGGGQPEAKPPTANVDAAPATTTAPVPSAAPTTASVAPAPAGTTAPAEAETVWRHDFTHDQAAAFMKTRVMPRMAKVFNDYDSKKYADVTCKTCHGPSFKEPKDFLPKLKFKDGKMLAFTEKPAVSKFMAEKVLPEMVAAMGLKMYDPKTHEGFGCNGCHTVDMK